MYIKWSIALTIQADKGTQTLCDRNTVALVIYLRLIIIRIFSKQIVILATPRAAMAGVYTKGGIAQKCQPFDVFFHLRLPFHVSVCRMWLPLLFFILDECTFHVSGKRVRQYWISADAACVCRKENLL